MDAYPEAPVPPRSPPADFNAPDIPDVENPVQPEPFEPTKLMKDDQ
jgi:hypothetical protein